MNNAVYTKNKKERITGSGACNVQMYIEQRKHERLRYVQVVDIQNDNRLGHRPLSNSNSTMRIKAFLSVPRIEQVLLLPDHSVIAPERISTYRPS